MKAFRYSNFSTQAFPGNSPGYQLIGELQLDPGSYVVHGRANIGANATSSPPPAYPHGGGQFALTFGGVEDLVTALVKPEDGENHATASLVVAATTDRTRRARFYFLTPYPLRVFVSAVTITAIQVDQLTSTTAGDPAESLLPREKMTLAEMKIQTGLHVGALEKLGDE